MSENKMQKSLANVIADGRGYKGIPVPYAPARAIWLDDFNSFLDRIEAAMKREADSIERIVRDAIIDYIGLYPSAPNDDAERELRERAAIANAWLKQHGFEEEPFHWSKEESPCL